MWFALVLVLTLTATITPFVLYAQQHAVGQLPPPREWFEAQGHNHGPWRELDIGFLVYQPFLVLIPLTLITGPLVAGYCRSVATLGASGMLILMQSVALWLHLQFLFWIID